MLSLDDEETVPETKKQGDTPPPETCKIGDAIICKVYEGCIVDREGVPWDHERTFTVIGKLHDADDNTTTLALSSPEHFGMKHTVRVSKSLTGLYGIDEDLVGSYTCFTTERYAIRIHKYSDGERCSGRCKEWFPMASSNGIKKFMCFQCKNDPYR